MQRPLARSRSASTSGLNPPDVPATSFVPPPPLCGAGSCGCVVPALLCLDTVALPLRTWSLYTSCILGGAFVFGSIPLFFEASVECTYPIAEGVTTGIMTLVLTCAFSFFYLLPTNSLLVAALTSLLVIRCPSETTSPSVTRRPAC